MYGLVINGKLSMNEGLPNLEQMQAVVGGLIETAYRGATNRKNITVDIYCNEEGLILDLPVSVLRRVDMSPIAGNLIIVGGDNSTGETASLTTEEIEGAFNRGFHVIDGPDAPPLRLFGL